MKKIGLLFSGSGSNDGSEIQEAVLTMLELDKRECEVVAMAPNIDQMHVVNHYTGQEMDEYRNVLVESSRIARGNIKDMAEVEASDIDGLIIPGGLGVSKNLCDYAMAGPECSVNPDVYRLISEVLLLKKPIGAICIAPILIAKILSEQNNSANLTIGSDNKTSKDIKLMGSNHFDCKVDEVIVDEENRIVTTPAYMEAKCINEVAFGIEKLVSQVLSLIIE